MNYWLVWWARYWQSWFTPLASNDSFYNEHVEQGSNVVPFSEASITRR